MTARELWDRGQEGWPRSYPVAQFPNAPLIVYLLAWVAQRVFDGDAHDVARGVGVVALSAWAYEELSGGVNLFRRALGLFVLVGVITGLAHDLR